MEPALLDQVRETLVRVGYTAENLGRTTGELPLPFSERSPRAMVYSYLFGRSPTLMTALLLFLSGASVSRRDVDALFGAGPCGDLLSRGILRKAGIGRLECPFHLFPFGDGWFFTDRAGAPLDADRRNAVLYLLQEQDLLAHAMITDPVGKALDLGTGSGVLAITASRFAGHVTAVDINPRALNFVSMNQALNRAANVTPLQSDLYAGVAGQTFDLILSNPPYNPSLGPAETRTLSLHGGPSGSEVLDAILHGLPSALAENGICQIVTRLFFQAGKTLFEQLSALLDPSMFNIFVMQTQPRPIFTLSNLEKTGWSVPPDQQTALFDHYRAHGIDRESFALVNLRRVGRGGRYHESIVNFEHLRQAPLYRDVQAAL
jgi:SAM-dependent methyltransferase